MLESGPYVRRGVRVEEVLLAVRHNVVRQAVRQDPAAVRQPGAGPTWLLQQQLLQLLQRAAAGNDPWDGGSVRALTLLPLVRLLVLLVSGLLLPTRKATLVV